MIDVFHAFWLHLLEPIQKLQITFIYILEEKEANF